MSTGPWGLIATYFNALGGNISESEKAREEAEQRDKQNRQPGYAYSSAPELDRSSFEASSPSTVGANLIGDYGKSFGNAVFGAAIKGEEDLYSPKLSTTGGYAIQPTSVDSSQPTYQNSGLANYLNYMKYRGGY